MPLFEFVCNKCKKEFEELVRDGKKPCCPECGSEDVKRKFSTFASPGSSSTSACSSCTSSSCSGCGAVS